MQVVHWLDWGVLRPEVPRKLTLWGGPKLFLRALQRVIAPHA